MIADCAAYRRGRRRSGQLTIRDVAGAEPETFAWVGLVEPAADELAQVRTAFRLDGAALEQALEDQPRPWMTFQHDVLYAMVKTAGYAGERVELGRVVFVVGHDFVVSARYGAFSGLAPVREELEANPALLDAGPCTVAYAAIDRIVEDFLPVIAELDTALRDVEQAVFSPEIGEHTARIYRLKREVLELQRASAPLTGVLVQLAAGRFPPIPQHVRSYYGNVEDRLASVADEIERVSALLSSMLDANTARMAMHQAKLALEQTEITTRQNEDMRRISAWVGIAAVPTMVGGIYGMNFRHMPELTWSFGYPLALGVMVALCGLVYWLFRRTGWL